MGKTTICFKLAQSLKYQHFVMDSLVIAFENVFPKTKVLHTDCWDFIKTSKYLTPFVNQLTQTKGYDKMPYKLAIDLYHITPKDYFQKIDKEKCEIYFFGYPDISSEEKLKEIRTYDTKWDWTNKESDEVVIKHIQSYIEISKWLEKECQKYHLL